MILNTLVQDKSKRRNCAAVKPRSTCRAASRGHDLCQLTRWDDAAIVDAHDAVPVSLMVHSCSSVVCICFGRTAIAVGRELHGCFQRVMNSVPTVLSAVAEHVNSHVLRTK